MSQQSLVVALELEREMLTFEVVVWVWCGMPPPEPCYF
jgi:hypothetical protein